jgi:hypothetical protein
MVCNISLLEWIPWLFTLKGGCGHQSIEVYFLEFYFHVNGILNANNPYPTNPGQSKEKYARKVVKVVSEMNAQSKSQVMLFLQGTSPSVVGYDIALK